MKNLNYKISRALRCSKKPLRYIVIVAAFIFAGYLPFLLQKDSQVAQAQQTHRPINVIVSKSVTPKPVIQNGSTAWSYNFANIANGPLPAKDWNFETGTTASNYNDEDQAYTSSTDNVRVENGQLIIEAKPGNLDGKQYTSARVDTKGKFDFTYGTFEVDMMLPRGDGTWPAAWLLPANNKYSPSTYGINSSDPFGWALNGEIDFAEAVGYIPGQNIPAAHSYNEVQMKPTYTPAYIPDSDSTYHEYGIIKTPDKITFTIDGKPYASRVKTSDSPLDWPYDQPYYVILDLAIGGKWAGADGVDNSTAPWELKVKSLSYTPL